MTMTGVWNPHIIHFLENGHYLCNGACGITKSKTTTTIENVTCKNCMNILFEVRMISGPPRCCGSLKCRPGSNPSSCSYVEVCMGRIRKDLKIAKRRECHHHSMQIRDEMEVRAAIKAQDDKIKEEGRWQGC